MADIIKLQKCYACGKPYQPKHIGGGEVREGYESFWHGDSPCPDCGAPAKDPTTPNQRDADEILDLLLRNTPSDEVAQKISRLALTHEMLGQWKESLLNYHSTRLAAMERKPDNTKRLNLLGLQESFFDKDRFKQLLTNVISRTEQLISDDLIARSKAKMEKKR